MFTLVNSLPLRQLILAQAPILAVSIIIAELFYKFHSFTLECIAFLATWYVLDLAANFLTKTLKKYFNEAGFLKPGNHILRN